MIAVKTLKMLCNQSSLYTRYHNSCHLSQVLVTQAGPVVLTLILPRRVRCDPALYLLVQLHEHLL